MAFAGTLSRMSSFDGLLFLGLHWAVVALAAWAFVDALIRPAAGFVAVGKLNKVAWAAITGAALLIDYLTARFLLGPLNILWLAGAVGTIVYLVDIRPKLRGLRGRKNPW